MATMALGARTGLRPRLSLPAILLIAQTLLWVPPVVIMVAFGPLPLNPDSGWTPEALAPLRTPWIAHQALMLLAFLCGGAGSILVARALLATPVRRLAWAALISASASVVCALTWAGLHFSMLGFSAPTLADLPAYWMATPIIVELHLTILVATLSLGLGLRRLGLAPRTGRVVAVLSGLLLPVWLVTPPFVYGLLWLPLGIALLRARPIQGTE